MRHIFPLLITNNYERAMVLCTCSFQSPEDKGNLKWKASIWLVKTINGSAFEEFNGLGAFVTSTDVSKLQWTLFRVPVLNNGPDAPVTATYTGSGEDGMFLSRKSLAAWILRNIDAEDSEWVGKAPALSN